MDAARAHRADEILKEIAGKGDFPATARSIARLRTVAPREDSNMLALAGVIMQDPGLSTKVLRVVNSAFYRPRDARVATISRAILLLGFDSIRDLATGILLIDSLFAHGASHAALRDNLRRSLHAALLSQALAERIGYGAREEAYLLGLFARLGHLWLAAHYREDYASALALAEAQRGAAVDDAIRQVIGVKPRDLAAGILEHWDLPDSYVEHFHRPVSTEEIRAAGAARLHAVVDAAAAHTASAQPGDVPGAPWLSRYERILGLSSEVLTDLVQRVDRAVAEQVAALGLEGGAETTWPAENAPATRTAPAAPSRGPSRESRSSVTPIAERQAGAAAAGAGPAEPPPAASEAAASAPAFHADLVLATEIAAEISRAIVERESLTNLLSAVLEGVARSGRFDVVALALATAAQDALRVRLAVGAGDDLASLSVPLERDAGMLAETALARTPRIVERGSSLLLVPRGARVPRQDIGSFLALPLLVRERLLGVLLAARADGSPGVSAADLPVAQLFGQLACVACTAQQA
jgi:eukaryotic-like serine/threonine-protein kinase